MRTGDGSEFLSLEIGSSKHEDDSEPLVRRIPRPNPVRLFGWMSNDNNTTLCVKECEGVCVPDLIPFRL